MTLYTWEIHIHQKHEVIVETKTMPCPPQIGYQLWFPKYGNREIKIVGVVFDKTTLKHFLVHT